MELNQLKKRNKKKALFIFDTNWRRNLISKLRYPRIRLFSVKYNFFLFDSPATPAAVHYFTRNAGPSLAGTESTWNEVGLSNYELIGSLIPRETFETYVRSRRESCRYRWVYSWIKRSIDKVVVASLICQRNSLLPFMITSNDHDTLIYIGERKKETSGGGLIAQVVNTEEQISLFQCSMTTI